MGLLDMLNEGQEQVAQVAQSEAAPAQAEKKMSYGARQRLKQIEAAQRVKAHLESAGVDLTPIQEDLDILLRTRKEGVCKTANGGVRTKPILYRLFGNEPKAGATVTAQEMFERTFKGFQEMRQLIKKWEAKGIKVEYVSADKTFVLHNDVEPWVESEDAE